MLEVTEEVKVTELTTKVIAVETHE